MFRVKSRRLNFKIVLHLSNTMYKHETCYILTLQERGGWNVSLYSTEAKNEQDQLRKDSK